MGIRWIALIVLFIVSAIAGLIWLGSVSGGPADIPDDPELSPESTMAEPLRIGLIPEREIFEQRRRYLALTVEISERLGRPIELVTENTYEGILGDLEAHRVDAAFVGSLVAVLAMDRHSARVLVKPVSGAEVSTYRGVLLSRADGPIEAIEDIKGKSIAMVHATTAAALFPIAEFHARDMMQGDDAPFIRWVGTHDAAVRELTAGRVDAAAAKDLRVLHYQSQPNSIELRWLAVSKPAPSNAIIVREGLDAEMIEALERILLELHEDDQGRAALERFGAIRFVSCEPEEYQAVREMVRAVGPWWPAVGVDGPAPQMITGEGEIGDEQE